MRIHTDADCLLPLLATESFGLIMYHNIRIPSWLYLSMNLIIISINMRHKPHSRRKHECDSDYRWRRTRFPEMVSLLITDWENKYFMNESIIIERELLLVWNTKII